MAKLSDLIAITHKVRVFETDAEVTAIQTAKTVFEVYGDYKGTPIEAKAGSSGGAVARWRHLATKTEK